MGHRTKAGRVLQGWDNFYFMMGSAAASLIGLLFIVVTLTAGSDRAQVQRGQALYMTPTALHFAMVLTACAVLLAPGLGVAARAAAFAFVGLVGMINAAKACYGILKMSAKGGASHWTDPLMYGVTPVAVYLGLLIAAFALGRGLVWGAYAIAALLLALLLTAIRNAWDLVTWIAPNRNAPPSVS